MHACSRIYLCTSTLSFAIVLSPPFPVCATQAAYTRHSLPLPSTVVFRRELSWTLLQWFRVYFETFRIVLRPPYASSVSMGDMQQQQLHPHASPQSSPRHSVSAPSGAVATDAATIAQLQAQIMQLYQTQQQQLAAAAAAAQPPSRAAPSVPSPQLPRIGNPSTFKGEMGFQVDDWLGELQQQFAYYGAQFSDDATRIRFAVAYLRGSALQWWDKCDQEAESWDAFVDALHNRFRPVQAPMLARQRLDKLRQRAGQSVNQYSNSFQTTLTPITDMSSADQVHHFINGLLPAIAAKVWERQPTELKAAIDLAVSIEAMSNFGRAAAAAPSSFSRAQGSTASSGSAPMDINHVSNDHEDAETASHCTQIEPSGSDAMLQALLTKMDARMEAMEHRVLALAGSSQGSSSSSAPRRSDNRVSGLKPGEIDQLMREKRCFRCKGTGHFKNDPKCPKASKSTPRSVNW